MKCFFYSGRDGFAAGKTRRQSGGNMNILILNGSPRKSGTVSQLLHRIESAAISAGHKVKFVDVPQLSFASCTGCMACRSKGTCVLAHDDAHTVAEHIARCDALAVGTSVYWGNMSGDLKRLFDRLVYALGNESPLGIPVPHRRGRRAVLVCACTTPFPFNILCGQTTKTLGALKEILFWSGFKVKAAVVVSGTKWLKDLPKRALRKAQKCARLLVRR